MATLLDDFLGSSLDAGWVFGSGSSGSLSVSGGDLHPVGSSLVDMHRGDWSVENGVFDLPFKAPTVLNATDYIGVTVKWLPTPAYPSGHGLVVYYDFSNHRLVLSPVFAPPHGNSLYTFGPYTIVAGAEAWIRATINGNDMTMGLYDSDPDAGGTQRISGSVTLADNTFSVGDGYDPNYDAYASIYGAGQSGSPGMIWSWGAAAGWAIHELQVADIPTSGIVVPSVQQVWPRRASSSVPILGQSYPRQ